MFARITVGDYATYRATFDSLEHVRRAAGVTAQSVFQSADDPNDITVELDFPTVEAAKAFASSDALREAMKTAGVQGPPTIWFANET